MTKSQSTLPQKLRRIWKSIIIHFLLQHKKLIPKKELEFILKQNAKPSFTFYSLLSIAALIAIMGLIANSTATIIGAMIIAPLMNPIVSFSYAIVSFNYKLLKLSIWTLVTGIIWVILMAFIVTQLLAPIIAGSEILGRANPNLLDLIVAMGAGIAGAFALTNRDVSTALPGVAIAIALVPPLCVVGIGFAINQQALIDPQIQIIDEIVNIENGAFLLFLTNLIAIIFCCGFIFVVQGYIQDKKGVLSVCISLLLLLLISLPLKTALANVILRQQTIHYLSQLKYENSDWGAARLRNIDINLNQAPPLIQLDVIAPVGLISESDAHLVNKYINQKLNKSFDFQVNLFEYNPLIIKSQ